MENPLFFLAWSSRVNQSAWIGCRWCNSMSLHPMYLQHSVLLYITTLFKFIYKLNSVISPLGKRSDNRKVYFLPEENDIANIAISPTSMCICAQCTAVHDNTPKRGKVIGYEDSNCGGKIVHFLSSLFCLQLHTHSSICFKRTKPKVGQN